MHLCIVVPIYNDWDCFLRLLHEIDQLGIDHIHILGVNDGSYELAPLWYENLFPFRHINRIEILHLVRNIGHQRAIAVGLVEIFKHFDIDCVIIMDSDGEDRPIDIPFLLQLHIREPHSVILARRAKRSEGWRFTVFYRLYQLLFKLFVGIHIDFGNFSSIPRQRLEYLVHNSDIWNHLAAAIIKSHLPSVKVDTIRGKRYTGQSKMRLTSLVLHGLSAISVYSDIVSVRLFIASGFVILISTFLVVLVVFIRFFTDLAIPGWATTAVGILILLAFQAIAFTGSLAFTILSTRSQPFLIPALEAPKFVKIRELIWDRHQQGTPLDE